MDVLDRSSREDVTTVILDRAAREPDFRRDLLTDPRTTLAETGVALPDDVRLRVVEEASDEVVLVLPPAVLPESGVGLPSTVPAAFAGTNISANSGCHQCCKPH